MISDTNSRYRPTRLSAATVLLLTTATVSTVFPLIACVAEPKASVAPKTGRSVSVSLPPVCTPFNVTATAKASPRMTPRRASLKAKLDTAMKELVELKLAKAKAEAPYDDLRQQADGGVPLDSPDVIIDREVDPRLRILRTEMTNLSVVRDNAVKKYGPQHHVVQNTDARLATIRKQIAARE